jgi:cysteine desulfurase/selenocysteine lyase
MHHLTTISPFDTTLIRKEFPVLHQEVNGHNLVYLDNAATTQKPKRVMQALADYYNDYNANIHRGIHTLAEKATHAFEQTRETVRSFINAEHVEEIVFVRGVTEAINLVASSYGLAFVEDGDEIIISQLEHHSNIVPWQWVCEKKKAKLIVIPLNDMGEIDMNKFKKLLSDRTKIVAVNHASNSLGTINPVKEITQLAHSKGAIVLIDGAQAGAHLTLDVQDIDCDFYCLSAHKMYGPTGVGILYGRKSILEKMPPYQGGGEMIREVTFKKTTYNDLPYKFEAGTPNIADVIAFRHSMEFILQLGRENVAAHERKLLLYASRKVGALPLVSLIGRASEKVGVLSFVIENIHPFDIGQMLDARGIAVRTGHHCTQPLMAYLGINGTVRASFAAYNTEAEVDALVESLKRIIKFLNSSHVN